MRRDLLQHEWQPAREPAGWHGRSEAERLRDVYQEYLRDVSRDFSRRRVARLHGPDRPPPGGWPEIAGRHRPLGANQDRFFEAPDDLSSLLGEDGLLRLDGDPVLSDGYLLWFRPEVDVRSGSGNGDSSDDGDIRHPQQRSAHS
jgi:hypothetical protein